MKIINAKKFISICLAFVMLTLNVAVAMGALALTVSASGETDATTWGEHKEHVYTYADFSPFDPDTGNAGTSTDPHIIITAEHLAALAAMVNSYDPASIVELKDVRGNSATANNFSGKYIKLVSDLDLSDHGWMAIGSGADTTNNVFKGNFDGSGYTVNGLSIGLTTTPDQSQKYAGLFGYVKDASIKNLGVIGTIYSNASVKYIGGIAGYVDSVSIINCFAQMTTGNPSYGGGIVGASSGGTQILNCYYRGPRIIGPENLGGIVGVVESGSKIILKNCFWLDSQEYVASSIPHVPIVWGNGQCDPSSENYYNLTEDKMTAASGGTDALIDKLNAWVKNEGAEGAYSTWHNHENTYPTFGSEGTSTFINGICADCDYYEAPSTIHGSTTYAIENAGQLFWFAQFVNGVLPSGLQKTSANATLMNDIDLNGAVWYPIGLYNDVAKAGGETVVAQYSGSFNGNGYTVSDFVASGNGSQGLFGYCTSSASVRNLGVIGAKVSGWNAGAIIGYGGQLTNCFARDCTITGVSSINEGAVNISSLGANNHLNSSINNCYAYNCTLIIDETETEYKVHPVGGTISSGEVAEINNSFYCNVNSDIIFSLNAFLMSRSEELMKNGTVTYALNGFTTTGVWGQDLDSGELPNTRSTSPSVYRGYLSCAENAQLDYTNDGTTVSDKPGHLDINRDHICDRDECQAENVNIDLHTDGDDDDHLCDYGCKGIADDGCFDTYFDKDHNCDECGAENITDHDDIDNNNVCDVCSCQMPEPEPEPEPDPDPDPDPDPEPDPDPDPDPEPDPDPDPDPEAGAGTDNKIDKETDNETECETDGAVTDTNENTDSEDTEPSDSDDGPEVATIIGIVIGSVAILGIGGSAIVGGIVLGIVKKKIK